ncbi:Txe/YoeB family addiction module toxin [Dyadobacter flavalbus]|uniref:Putative mRNA interferase YoeB n=1 Tax=Dyadobacter flavalbus TaxID=2579942 RepID=A0A5M8QC69_9BACT|nr:Txe/YoeB family addiction module toxin [Dyadobacter flavalbus]KAA6432683.1 Txe/YoeB family addiction module toxin [Dyadobacter flavalbus]
MKYILVFSDKAKEDLKFLKMYEPQAYKKARLLIEELTEHPKTGRGKPQLKKHNLAGLYARKITDKHRLLYSINEQTITEDIISSKGHYNDK